MVKGIDQKVPCRFAGYGKEVPMEASPLPATWTPLGTRSQNRKLNLLPHAEISSDWLPPFQAEELQPFPCSVKQLLGSGGRNPLVCKMKHFGVEATSLFSTSRMN